MSNKWHLLISTAIGLIVLPKAGVAQQAGNSTTPQPPLPPPAAWAGPYAGVELGWAGNHALPVHCSYVGTDSPCIPSPPAVDAEGFLPA